MQFALQQVQARVNQVRADLPAGLAIEVERLTPSLFPILSYNLEGGDPATLYDIARYQMKPVLSRVPGRGARGRAGHRRARDRGRRRSGAARGASGLTYDDLADGDPAAASRWPRWGACRRTTSST